MIHRMLHLPFVSLPDEAIIGVPYDASQNLQDDLVKSCMGGDYSQDMICICIVRKVHAQQHQVFKF